MLLCWGFSSRLLKFARILNRLGLQHFLGNFGMALDRYKREGLQHQHIRVILQRLYRQPVKPAIETITRRRPVGGCASRWVTIS